MAQRRMFSPSIVESDAFLDMPASSQALYFHLGMYADDDGFVNPRRIMRMASFPEDDLKVLIGKRFVLPFETGVVVIKHWRINNLIRKDWYKETLYIEEKKMLKIKDNSAYTEAKNISLTTRQRIGNGSSTQYNIGKDSIGKNSIVSSPAANAAVEEPLTEKSKIDERRQINEIVEHFFHLKGWSGRKKFNIVIKRYARAAKELLGLCEGDVNEAKTCITKVGVWAESRKLDWTIETVFRKWYDIDLLKAKEKLPYYKGQRAFQMGGKWYVMNPNGERFEFAGNLKEIEYR